MGRKPDSKQNLNKESQTQHKKKGPDEDINLIVGVFFLILYTLIFLWRGPSFLENISLFTQGDRTKGTVEQRIASNARKGVQARILYSFNHADSTVNSESRMFEPLMILTSKVNEKDQQVFTVV